MKETPKSNIFPAKDDLLALLHEICVARMIANIISLDTVTNRNTTTLPRDSSIPKRMTKPELLAF